MLSRPIINETFRTISLQPALLFALIIEAAILLFLIFGIQLEFENETLISIRMLGREFGEVTVFLSYFLPSFARFVPLILMFLFIVGSAGLYCELLTEPLLGVILTKPLSRAKLFQSKFIGMFLAISANIVLLSVLISTILTSKMDGSLVVSPVAASFSFLGEFAILSACISLFAILTESTTAAVLLAMAFYFVLGPLLMNVEKTGNLILIIISYLIPEFGKLAEVTQGLLLEKQVNLTDFPYALLLAAIYFGFASFLFNRRDL